MATAMDMAISSASNHWGMFACAKRATRPVTASGMMLPIIFAGLALTLRTVGAQTAPASPVAPNVEPMSAVAPLVTAPDAYLPAAGTTPALRLTPLAEINEHYTDNVALLAGPLARSDWVSEVVAGLQIDYRAARANAQVDFHINRLFHREFDNLDNTQRFLNSHASLEAVEKWLFVDARANISQQNRSAFGSTSIADLSSVSTNRVETTTYQLSPYVHGDVGDIATYLLRLNMADTRTDEVTFPHTRTRQWTAYIKNQPSSGWLGWSLDGNSLGVDNVAVGRRDDSRLRASLTFEADSQLHLSVSGGTESSDLNGQQKRTNATYGYGLEWSPSPRTQFAGVTQKRFFGNDHLIAFSHRTALTAWRYSSSKEVAVSTSELAGSTALSVNNLLLDLLAASIPDPTVRAEQSKQRFEQSGIPASSGIQDGFLTVRPFLNRRQAASVALVGLRNTITFEAGVREQRALDGNNATLAGPPIEEIRQVNANAAWAYKLSPVSTLKLVISHLHTKGLFLENLNSTQRLQSLFFVTKLGLHTTASLGFQRTVFDSSVFSSYRENVFVSTISLHF